jgi:hypothetical protein
VVFGMAAACGFLAFRLLNASSPRQLRSPDRGFPPGSGRGTDWHPDPRLGGSAYPVATPNAQPTGSTYPGSMPAAPAGASAYTASTPPAAQAASSYPKGAGETSPPISPSSREFHGR